MKQLLLPLILFSVFLTSEARAMYFWDANGSTAGSGGPTPTGAWGVDAYWNDAKVFADPPDPAGSMGTGPTIAWSDAYTAVFAAGDDALGEYTVIVSNTIQVADIHVDQGTITFAPDPVAGGAFYLVGWYDFKIINTTNRLLSVGHDQPNTIARYNVPLTGATNIIRYKRGTLILGVTNAYAGSTTVEGGILQLGAPQVIPNDSNLILSNNDDREDVLPRGIFTPATLFLDGFSQTLGTLDLTGPDAPTSRTIDFGNGAAALAFADSSGENWIANDGADIPLFIANFTPGSDTLRFGVNSQGLTSQQLSQIRFLDFANLPGKIDAQGFVTPVLPRILSVTRPNPSQTDLTWSSVPDRNYRIQYKDDLNATSWTDVVPDVPATTETTSYSDASATTSTRFYRIMVVP